MLTVTSEVTGGVGVLEDCEASIVDGDSGLASGSVVNVASDAGGFRVVGIFVLNVVLIMLEVSVLIVISGAAGVSGV